MKQNLRKMYSIISLFFTIVTIIQVILFIVDPDYLYRLIDVVYSVFISFYLLFSSGNYNKANNKFISIIGIMISLVGLFITVFLNKLFLDLLGYSNIFANFEKIHLTIYYFKITIYVLFLIINVLSLIFKEKKLKFRRKNQKSV